MTIAVRKEVTASSMGNPERHLGKSGNPGNLGGRPSFSWNLGDGLRMQFYTGNQFAESLVTLKERAAILNDTIFRLNPLWTAEEIHFHMPSPEELTRRRRLREPRDMRDSSIARSITFASLDDRDIGMIIQNLLVVILPDGRNEMVLWTSMRGVEQQSQSRGIGTELVRRSVEAHMLFNFAPSYVMGRSQNEVVFLTLERSRLFDVIFGLHRDFDAEPSSILGQMAPQTMHPVRVDERTGLAIGQYREGKTGGYEEINLEHQDLKRINDVFVAKGLDKDRGDALFYAARVKTVFDARRRLLRSVSEGRRVA